MKYLVKDTPIRKNNKTYGVGEEFPYSDKDKSLLDKGFLTKVKESEKAKDGPTKIVEPKAVENKKDTAPKKVVPKKKTNSKK